MLVNEQIDRTPPLERRLKNPQTTSRVIKPQIIAPVDGAGRDY